MIINVQSFLNDTQYSVDECVHAGRYGYMSVLWHISAPLVNEQLNLIGSLMNNNVKVIFYVLHPGIASIWCHGDYYSTNQKIISPLHY